MGDKTISIIYANRNRDLPRIEISLNSLSVQTDKNFDVVFVDYGSDASLAKDLELLTSKFQFVKLYLLEVSQLLWNKSKALNFGIKKAETSYVFIADVDLVFHPESVTLMKTHANPDKFCLFNLGYLGEKESVKLKGNYLFNTLKPYRKGVVNGMILTSRDSLIEVNGFDEFFHFYGAEDEDLFCRLELSGIRKEKIDVENFYHNWHTSFSGSEDKLLTGNPRVKNIMRTNQRHFYRNRDRKILKPLRQNEMGVIVTKDQRELLKKPSVILKIVNISTHIEHFLKEELPSYKNEIVKLEFVEDPYFHSLKFKYKEWFGKQDFSYCTMKDVNDMILKEILFRYRNSNYSFQISKDLKTITFIIEI